MIVSEAKYTSRDNAELILQKNFFCNQDNQGVYIFGGFVHFDTNIKQRQ